MLLVSSKSGGSGATFQCHDSLFLHLSTCVNESLAEKKERRRAEFDPTIYRELQSQWLVARERDV